MDCKCIIFNTKHVKMGPLQYTQVASPLNTTLSTLEFELFFGGSNPFDTTLKELILRQDLEKYSNVVINISNVEVATSISGGLKPLVVYNLSKVARWHLCKLLQCECFL